jgi:tetratricopeptide (TPR) repeat protein
MFQRLIICLLTLLFTFDLIASVRNAEVIFQRNKGDRNSYLQIAEELINSKLYYSAIPFVKEYLNISNSKNTNLKLDYILEKIVSYVGIKQFEILPQGILKNSLTPTIRFIRAKKYFREGQYGPALKMLERPISVDHPIHPFALQLEGSVYSIQKNYKLAMQAFDQCLDSARKRIFSADNKYGKKQLEINEEYCKLGKARTYFAAKLYEKADQSYGEFPKDSYVWPEILLEEAWTSFYLKTYNRTLGKLVTYKAPLLDHYFKPEVNVLRALTFFEMCLYVDATHEIETFYKTYLEPSKWLKNYLKANGSKYKKYYEISVNYLNNNLRANPILLTLLGDITKRTAYDELMDSYLRGRREIDSVKELPNTAIKNVLIENLRSSLRVQRDLIGAYVRKALLVYYKNIFNTFEQMSYIKLEMLSYKKAQLYQFENDLYRSRGDINYLTRQGHQYFWSFNQEFWVDELGDYVFALKPECK